MSLCSSGLFARFYLLPVTTLIYLWVELPGEKAESRQREGAAHLPSAGFLLTVNFWSIASRAARSRGFFLLEHVAEKSEAGFPKGDATT
jgi:hypothetical protein